MITCDVCGSLDFEKHAGFLYCAVCQTQSQDYYEQEYEFQDHEFQTVRRPKSKVPRKKIKKEYYDDGLWITWEAFNYILYGMTDEIKKFGVTNKFQETVFKLWAAYLKECQAAFTSKTEEKIPKLGFGFKQRDARILYKKDISSNPHLGRKSKNGIYGSKILCSSDLTMSSQSKRSIAKQRGKVIASDYLSLSMQSTSSLNDETLESIGKPSDLEVTLESSGSSESSIISLKRMLRKDDYKLYKKSYRSQKLLMSAKAKFKRNVKWPGKNKLLSIIHLALLMTDSQIQLSDLLRFIREGHLSFAKVTHFFPKGMKLPKNDVAYIEVTSDSLMPTHLRQRKIATQLAALLRIASIPTANTNKLVDRYCKDLNLPEQLAELSKKVLKDCIPSTTVPKSKTCLPSSEAWAMVSVIFVMKLLFGLNDRTEIFLSHFAREVNSSRTSDLPLFVFEDWQKFIEYRKSVLINFHYPTVEQLSGNPFQSSRKFLDAMMSESKDEYRNERFIPYSKYYVDEKLLDGVKEMLNAISSPQDVTSLDFQPSLTPQTSHMETIMRKFLQCEEVSKKQNGSRPSEFPPFVLQQSFKNCDIKFASDLKNYIHLLERENSDLFQKFHIDPTLSSDESFKKKTLHLSVLMNCSSTYWILKYPKASSGQLDNFREEIFEKTPENFQWLMTECARMLEMNVRDVYDELLRLEQRIRTNP